MFKITRIKLTAWYLLIIMLVSVSFSIVIYRVLTNELDRIERVERVRIERRLGLRPPFLDPDVVAETKNRLTVMLVGINILILGGSAVAGYFLAGRTLTPIAEMLNEQNRFITDASHELRTPLTSLKSEIEVNLRNKDLTIADARQLLQSNLEEVNNLQALSDGLIKLTQFEKGIDGIEMAQVQLTPVLKDAMRRVSTAAKAKHISISSTVHALAVTGNSMLLTELLVILLDNAIKYSPRGKTIRVTAEKTDSHIKLRVIDQGYGIRKDDLPHLFNRFWRADKSRNKTATNGYGLGLAIAKQIIDRHHGSIDVTSTVGKGTTFTIGLQL